MCISYLCVRYITAYIPAADPLIVCARKSAKIQTIIENDIYVYVTHNT